MGDWLGLIQHELMLFALACFMVLATDDLLVDLIWLSRNAYRRQTIYRRYPRATAAELPSRHRPNFALFVPAWQESRVIAALLRCALQAYEKGSVTIFVGCYPNDAETRRVVEPFTGQNIVLVVNERDGPTTKADCLNAIWRRMRAAERQGKAFDGIIIHDAEDRIDDYELTVFSALWHRFSAIHLPVIPIASRQTPWVGNHYCDEFAEAHIKSQVVREAIGAALPSAGVGCLLRRDLVDALDALNPDEPFARDSLTEDYELGLKAKALGLQSAFVRIRHAPGTDMVATRALFPHSFKAAVRQKSRWIAGIAIFGWDRMGWGGGIAEIWMRIRDRKSLLSAFALAAGYASIGLIAFGFHAESGSSIAQSVALLWAVYATGALAIWRLFMRFACVSYVYGWREGTLSLPRIVVCNAIAIAAAVRAVMIYIKAMRTGRVVWDKTDHYDHPGTQS